MCIRDSIRAGIALLIAALSAKGESRIDNIAQIRSEEHTSELQLPKGIHIVEADPLMASKEKVVPRRPLAETWGSTCLLYTSRCV